MVRELCKYTRASAKLMTEIFQINYNSFRIVCERGVIAATHRLVEFFVV